MGEPQEGAKPFPKNQQVIRPFSNPIKKDGHLVILRGNLAPEGAVAKISGKEGLVFRERPRCLNPRRRRWRRFSTARIKKGHVIVIRYEGPRGGPGMREMLSPTSPSWARGWARTWR
jgi:dihydroxy-acid dehydratase